MSHLNDGEVPEEYNAYLSGKLMFVLLSVTATVVLLVVAVSLGPVHVSLVETCRALAGMDVSAQARTIILHIRLPQAFAAILAGAGLAGIGVTMQSILRNPLGSPFTLGMSNAAAFGAALAVMLSGGGIMSGGTSGGLELHANQYVLAFSAFACCVAAAVVIIGVAGIRGSTPEVMVLTGVAIGSVFAAGTMFLQYFASDVQLAAMVFWTFGDVGRAGWSQIGLLAVIVPLSLAYFAANRWNYNAIDAGDETAMGLGVRVGRVRLAGMLLASVVTAAIVSVLGIIGFVGLVCPHMARRFVGGDHRFLLPASCLLGAVLLLASDTAARLILSNHVLPVSVLTAFLGAPVFVYLIIRGYRR